MTHNLLLRLMGNCLLSSPQKTQNIHHQILRVVRVDTGKVLEYKESVLVKDLLMNFYGGFFVGLTQDADHSRRLAPDHQLKIGKIYYLIPIISSSTSTPSSVVVDGDDKQSKGEVTRIKVVITKKQLEELLSNKVSMEQVMVLGFHQKGRSYAGEGEGEDEEDRESSRGNWRPKLETIPE